MAGNSKPPGVASDSGKTRGQSSGHRQPQFSSTGASRRGLEWRGGWDFNPRPANMDPARCRIQVLRACASIMAIIPRRDMPADFPWPGTGTKDSLFHNRMQNKSERQTVHVGWIGAVIKSCSGHWQSRVKPGWYRARAGWPGCMFMHRCTRGERAQLPRTALTMSRLFDFRRARQALHLMPVAQW